jgi:hypothetical protein
MALEIRRAGEQDYTRWVKMLVAGHPGAGKTRFASQWPNVLYAAAEANLMSVRDRGPAVIDIKSSAQLLELRQILAQPRDVRAKVLGKAFGMEAFDVQTIVVDTVDEVARLLIRERLQANRKDAMQIADWGWLGDQLRGITRGFRTLPDLHVLLNVHLKGTEDSETGRTVIGPAIQGAMGDEIPGYVDLAFRLVARPTTKVVDGQTIREVVRYFQTYPDAQHEWIKDCSGCLPLEFPIDFSTDYQRLMQAIYGEAAEPVAATVVEEPKAEKRTRKIRPPAPAEPAAAPAVAETAVAVLDPPVDAIPPVPPEPPPVPPPPPPVPPSPPPIPPTPPPPVPPAPPSAPEATVIDADEPDAPFTDAQEARICEGVDSETAEICGKEVETKDQWDLSFIRFRKHLCRACFAKAKRR